MLVHKCNTQHQQNLVQHVIPLFCCSLWWLFIYLFFQNLLPWWHPSNYFNDLTRHLHCYLPQPSTAWKRKWNEKQEEFYGSVCLHLPTCKCNQKWIKISFNLMSDVEHFRAMAPKMAGAPRQTLPADIYTLNACYSWLFCFEIFFFLNSGQSSFLSVIGSL